MKNILPTFLFGIFLYSCSSAKIGGYKTKYFNENNVEISKSEFKRSRLKNKFLEIEGDSVNHKKLTIREKRDKINNRKALEKLLEKELNHELESNKPIVIIYRPGKDPCNSSGTTDQGWIQNWFGQLEEGLKQIAKVKPIYIYKNMRALLIGRKILKELLKVYFSNIIILALVLSLFPKMENV
ncbi:hypothetical protein [Gelidibacter japonicus]|uniref:hypothetical protein n=1 Tax=Gelidibacter japonicus TaxID=1962232 RepID=UPI0013D17E9E|nr:hypothetical protein [Gelidibacter japonicus]